MKKYITPNSECITIIGAMLMETPSDNLGVGSQNAPEKPKPTDPKF